MSTTYDVRKTAKILGVGTAMVYKLAKTGKLPYIRIGDKYKFTGPALREFLELPATEHLISADSNQEKRPRKSKAHSKKKSNRRSDKR